jgi:dinuclear metal center YbgI/SA1388 family protein
MTSASTLAQVVAALERRYPLSTAESWDAVGLVCGNPGSEVRRVLWAVDPVERVVDEAIEAGVDLVVTHHPLFLSGVHSVAATTAKGRIVHRLVEAGIALYCAHTNADVADPGVSDALAGALGLTRTVPIIPAFEIAERPSLPTSAGLGRIGYVEPDLALAEFAARVAEALPATHHGVRVAGAEDLRVRRVAVCGGSGDSMLGPATALGADVLVTADLKHHRALEHIEDGGCAIVDVAHWASEWPWLEQAALLLSEDLDAQGATVGSTVSTIPTDPWGMTLRS